MILRHSIWFVSGKQREWVKHDNSINTLRKATNILEMISEDKNAIWER